MAALDIAGPEDEVRPARLKRLQQSRQEADRMAEIGVDLDDDVGVAGEDIGEACNVGAAQTLLGLAMEDRDRGILPGQLVGQLPCAVGRAVVYDQDVGSRDRLEDRGADRADVVALVVGRDDDPNLRACVRLDRGCLGDVLAGRHRCPWCERVAGENTLSLPYPAGWPRHIPFGRFFRTHGNAQRNRSIGLRLRVYWPLWSSRSGHPRTSRSRRPALRPLPELPPAPLHSDFRDPQSAFPSQVPLRVLSSSTKIEDRFYQNR